MVNYFFQEIRLHFPDDTIYIGKNNRCPSKLRCMVSKARRSSLMKSSLSRNCGCQTTYRPGNVDDNLLLVVVNYSICVINVEVEKLFFCAI